MVDVEIVPAARNPSQVARAFLGVWAPMILGLLLIALAVNSLLVPSAVPANPGFPLNETAARACGGGVILVGGLLILSTLGRWRKIRLARRG